jgi:hypothetical protein
VLPADARKRSTFWVTDGQSRAHPIRCGVEGESLYCFGDELVDVAAGTRVSVTLYELHSGPPIVTFPATLQAVDPADVSLGLLSDIVGYRSHPQSYDELRRTRRIVELAA